MCAAPAPGPAPPPQHNGFTNYNFGDSVRDIHNIKVIIVHASFGDATLLEVTPKDKASGAIGPKRHYLIDGGPTALPGGQDGAPVVAFYNLEETFLKYAYKTAGQNVIKSEGIVITHPDSDHIEGVLRLFKKFPPNQNVGQQGISKFEFTGPLMLTEFFEKNEPKYQEYMKVFTDASFKKEPGFATGQKISAFEEQFELYYPLDKYPGVMYNYKKTKAAAGGPKPRRILAAVKTGAARYAPDASEPNLSSTLIVIENPVPANPRPLVSLNGDGMGADVLKALNDRKPKIFKVPHHGSVHNSIPLANFKPAHGNLTCKLLATEILILKRRRQIEPKRHAIVEKIRLAISEIKHRADESTSRGASGDIKALDAKGAFDKLAIAFVKKLNKKEIQIQRLLTALKARSAKIEQNVKKIKSIDEITKETYTNGVDALPTDFTEYIYDTARREILEEAKTNGRYKEDEMYLEIFKILETNVYVEELTFLLIRAFYQKICADTYFISSGDRHGHPTWEIINGIIAAASDYHGGTPGYKCRLLLTTGTLHTNRIKELYDPNTNTGILGNDDWRNYVSIQYFTGDEHPTVEIDHTVDPLVVLPGTEKWDFTTDDSVLIDARKRHGTANGAIEYQKSRLITDDTYEITPLDNANFWLELTAPPAAPPFYKVFQISNGTVVKMDVTLPSDPERDGPLSGHINVEAKLSQVDPAGPPDTLVRLRPGKHPSGFFSNAIYVLDGGNRKYLNVHNTTGVITYVDSPDNATYFRFKQPGVPRKIMPRKKRKGKTKRKTKERRRDRSKGKVQVVKPTTKRIDINIGGPSDGNDVIIVPENPDDNNGVIIVPEPGGPDQDDKSFDSYLDSLGITGDDAIVYNMYDAIILLLQSSDSAYYVVSSFPQIIIKGILEVPVDEDETTIEFVPTLPTNPLVLTASIEADFPTSGKSFDLGLSQPLILNELAVVFPDIVESKMYISGSGKIGNEDVNVICRLPEPKKLPEIEISLAKENITLASVVNLLSLGKVNVPSFKVPLMTNLLGSISITEAGVAFNQGAKDLQKVSLSKVILSITFTNLSSYLPTQYFDNLKTVSSRVIIHQPLGPTIQISAEIDFKFLINLPSKTSVALTATLSTMPVNTDDDVQAGYDITVAIQASSDDTYIGTGASTPSGISIADFLSNFGLRGAINAAQSVPILQSILEKVQLKRLLLGLNSKSTNIKGFALELYAYDWTILSNKVKLDEANLMMYYVNDEWTARLDATATFGGTYPVGITFELLGNDLPTKFSFINYLDEFTILKFLEVFGLGSLGNIPVVSSLLNIAVTEVTLELTGNTASDIKVSSGKVSLHADSINIGSIFELSQVDVTLAFVQGSSQSSYNFAFSVGGFINKKLYVRVEYDPNFSILSGTLRVSSFKEATLVDAIKALLGNNGTSQIDSNSVYNGISNSTPSASVQFSFKHNGSESFTLQHFNVDLNKVFTLGRLSMERLRFEYQYLEPDPRAGRSWQKLYKLLSVLTIGDNTLGAVLEFDLKASTSGNVVTASIKPTDENALTVGGLLREMSSDLPAVPEINGKDLPLNFFDLSLTKGTVTFSYPITEIKAFTIHVETSNEITLIESPLIKLKKVSLKVEYESEAQPTKTTACLIGIVTIGGVELTLQGSKEANGDTVFRLLATSETDSTSVDLQKGIGTLTPTGTTSPIIPSDIGIPKPLNVLMAELIVKYSPSNNENSILFTGTTQLNWPIDLGFQQFTVKQVGGKISYKKSTNTQTPAQYDAFVTGEFEFSNNIMMSSELHFGGDNVDTVLSVAVADANQVKISSVTDDFLGFHDPQDSDSKTFDELKHEHTKDFEPHELFININFTKKIFGMFGKIRDDKLGLLSLIAGDFSTDATTTTNYGYVFGISFPSTNFEIKDFFPSLREIDNVLKVRNASCIIVSLKNVKVSDVVAKIKAVQQTAVSSIENFKFPFQELTLNDLTKEQELQPGISFYCELDFNLLDDDSPFKSIIKITSGSEDVPDIILSVIMGTNDPRNSEFKAFISSLTLLGGAFKFNDITLIYRPSNETTFELNGKLTITLGNASLDFLGQFTCSSTQSVFSVSTGHEHTVVAPLGMTGVKFENVKLTLTYNHAGNQPVFSNQSLSGEVRFFSHSSDISSPTATPSIVLTGTVLFNNYVPVVVKFELESDKPLTIADLITTLFLGDYNTTHYINIGFVAGRLYYAKLDSEDIQIDGITYKNGYHISADIEIFEKIFTVEADIIPNTREISVSGFVKNGAIDLGFAKFTGATSGEPDESKSPELVFKTGPTSTSISLRIGFIILGYKFGVGEIGFTRQDGINKFYGTLSHKGDLGFIKDPSIGFEWSKENGFKVTNWPVSGNFAFNLFDKIKTYKDSCKSLVNLVFKEGVNSEFNVKFGLSKTDKPDQFLAQIDVTGTYDVKLFHEVKIASVPLPPISIGVPKLNTNGGDFTLSDLPGFVLNLFTQNADDIVKQIFDHKDRLAKILGLSVLKEVTKEVIASFVCRKVNKNDFDSDDPENEGDEDFEDPAEEDMDLADSAEDALDEAIENFAEDLAETLGEEALGLGAAAGSAAAAEGSADVAAGGFGAVIAGVVAFLAAIGLGFLVGYSSMKKKKKDAEEGKKRVEEKRKQKIINEMKKQLDINGPPRATFQAPNKLIVSWNKSKYPDVNYRIVVSGMLYNEHQQTTTPTELYNDIISDTEITITNNQFYNVVSLKVTVNGTIDGIPKDAEGKPIESKRKTYDGPKYSVDVTGVHPTLHSPSNLRITYYHSSRQISVTATPISQTRTYYFELLDNSNPADNSISTPLATRTFNTYSGSTQIQFTFSHSDILEDSVPPFKVRAQSIGKSGSSLASSPYVFSNTLQILPPPTDLVLTLPHFNDNTENILLEWTLPGNTTGISSFTGHIIDVNSKETLLTQTFPRAHPNAPIPKSGSFNYVHLLTAVKSLNYKYSDIVEMKIQLSSTSNSQQTIDSVFLVSDPVTTLRSPDNMSAKFVPDTNSLQISWDFSQQTSTYGVEIWDYSSNRLIWRRTEEVTIDDDVGDFKVGKNYTLSDIAVINEPNVQYSVQIVAVSYGNEIFDSFIHNTASTALSLLAAPSIVFFIYQTGSDSVSVYFVPVPNGSKYSYIIRKNDEQDILYSLISTTHYISFYSDKILDKVASGDTLKCSVQSLGEGSTISSPETTYPNTMTVLAQPTNLSYAYNEDTDTITITATTVPGITKYLVGGYVPEDPLLIGNSVSTDLTVYGNSVQASFHGSILRQSGTAKTWKFYIQTKSSHYAQLPSPRLHVEQEVTIFAAPNLQSLDYADNKLKFTLEAPIEGADHYKATVYVIGYNSSVIHHFNKNLPTTDLTIDLSQEVPNWDSVITGSDLSEIRAFIAAGGSTIYQLKGLSSALKIVTRTSPPSFFTCQYSATDDKLKVSFRTITIPAGTTVKVVASSSSGNKEITKEIEAPSVNQVTEVTFTGKEIRDQGEKEWTIYGQTISHFTSRKEIYSTKYTILDTPHIQSAAYDVSTTRMGINWDPVYNANKINVTIGYETSDEEEHETTLSAHRLGTGISFLMKYNVSNWGEVSDTSTFSVVLIAMAHENNMYINSNSSESYNISPKFAFFTSSSETTLFMKWGRQYENRNIRINGTDMMVSKTVEDARETDIPKRLFFYPRTDPDPDTKGATITVDDQTIDDHYNSVKFAYVQVQRLYQTVKLGYSTPATSFNDGVSALGSDIVGIKRVEINYNDSVTRIRVTYRLANGSQYFAPFRGKYSSSQATIELENQESIIAVTASSSKDTGISRMIIVTQKSDGTCVKHGPYGTALPFIGQDVPIRFSGNVVSFKGSTTTSKGITNLGFHYALITPTILRGPLLGGNGGVAFEHNVMSYVPQVAYVTRLYIQYDSRSIVGFQPTYKKVDGSTETMILKGGHGYYEQIHNENIYFEEGEKLIGISGKADHDERVSEDTSDSIITTLQLRTQKADGTTKEYGPYGKETNSETNTSFHASGTIHGFYGYAGWIIDSLGVYSSLEWSEVYGGPGGYRFEDVQLHTPITRMKALHVRYNNFKIMSIQCTYLLSNGLSWTGIKHGSYSTLTGLRTIEFEEGEDIVSMIVGKQKLSSSEEFTIGYLEIVTQKKNGRRQEYERIYDDYQTNSNFRGEKEFKGRVVSLIGRSSISEVNALGIRYIPLPQLTSPITLPDIKSVRFGGLYKGTRFNHKPDIPKDSPIARIKTLKLQYDSLSLVSIRPVYEFENGFTYEPAQQGGDGYSQTITSKMLNFDDSEILIGISGRSDYDSRVGGKSISQIIAVTQDKDGKIKTYGPYGNTNSTGTKFITWGKVVGFYGQSGNIINQLGVYVSLNRTDILGGDSGIRFADGHGYFITTGIKSLKIRHSHKIHSIQAEYWVSNGTNFTDTVRGTDTYGTLVTHEFEEGEDIIAIRMTMAGYVIGGIDFTTQKRDGTIKNYERIGVTSEGSRDIVFKGRVVSLIGRSQYNVNALGIKYIPLPEGFDDNNN